MAVALSNSSGPSRLRPVHKASTLNGWPLRDLTSPSFNVWVLLGTQELANVVRPTKHQRPIPREDSDVSDRIIIANEKAPTVEAPIEDVELALYVHRVAVDGIFTRNRCVSIEM